MKIRVLLWIGALLPLAVAAASPEGAGREMLDRQTGRLSANLLLSDWRSRFATPDFPQGTGRIFEEMKRDCAGNAAVAVARKNAEVWFRNELQMRYREEAGRVLESFEPILEAAVLEKMRQGNEAFFEKRFEELFPAAFEVARKRLAEEQRVAVFARIYPSAEELEKSDDAALTQLLETRFRARLKEPLLEENVPLLRSELIAPVIAAGRAQQKLQLTLLARQTIPAELWDEDAVRENLTQSVEKAVAAAIPESERFALFPRTRTEISRRAAQLPIERTVSALPDSVDLQFYREALRRETAKHRDPEASRKSVASGIQLRMVVAAMEKVGFTPEQQKSIAVNPEVSAAAARRFRERIVPEMNALRKTVAEEELKAHWPELVGGEWTPSAGEVEMFAASGGKSVPELSERPAEQPLLREAEEEQERLIRAKLVSEVAVLEHQRQLVNDVYDTVVNEMRRKQYSGRKSWLAGWLGIKEHAVSLSEIQTCYRARVNEKADSRELFPSVDTEIDVRSRAILQQLEEEPESKAEELAQELPIIQYTVRLEDIDGKLTVRLGSWTISGAPGEAERLYAALLEELKQRMAEVTVPSRFEIRILVSGADIRYREVAELRDKLHEAAGNDSRILDAYHQGRKI